uniref:Uncharacterized protein n=1 Tax=Anguilla anguilla TaxID=7936 RepID=A0A0E9VQT1_ANGAN
MGRDRFAACDSIFISIYWPSCSM